MSIWTFLMVIAWFLIQGSSQPAPQIPMPAPPTKADLFAAVAQELGVDRAILTAVLQDQWLAGKIREAGIQDITQAPVNQPLPHDTLTGWQERKRFKIAVVDSKLPPKSEAIEKKIAGFERKFDLATVKLATDSANFHGSIKKLSERVDALNQTIADGALGSRDGSESIVCSPEDVKVAVEEVVSVVGKPGWSLKDLVTPGVVAVILPVLWMNLRGMKKDFAERLIRALLTPAPSKEVVENAVAKAEAMPAKLDAPPPPE